MKRGEVWWVAFDPAVGSEIRKTRPAVIVSNNAANRQLARVGLALRAIFGPKSEESARVAKQTGPAAISA